MATKETKRRLSGWKPTGGKKVIKILSEEFCLLGGCGQAQETTYGTPGLEGILEGWYVVQKWERG